jgi:hypothetical protein
MMASEGNDHICIEIKHPFHMVREERQKPGFIDRDMKRRPQVKKEHHQTKEKIPGDHRTVEEMWHSQNGVVHDKRSRGDLTANQHICAFSTYSRCPFDCAAN